MREQGTIFLGGPPLVKAATGEVVDAETLGGGDVHARMSGVADHLADNDAHALAMARRHRRQPQPREARRRRRAAAGASPLYDAEELYGIIPRDTRKPYDVREVIARLVDGSELDEFKALYGTTLVMRLRAHRRLSGRHHRQQRRAVLRVRAQGRALHRALQPARRIPLLFLQNITGFMVGRKYESGGIASDGAKMVTAVACATVPKFTVIIGGSFGAGNYGMCGRAYGAALSVDVAERAHLGDGRRAGGDRARHRQARRACSAAARTGRTRTSRRFATQIREQYEHAGHPYYATRAAVGRRRHRPADTRAVLGARAGGVDRAARSGRVTGFGVFRM